MGIDRDREHKALLPVLPCPECKERGHGGNARIGNHRRTCSTCNNFAQNVMRISRQRLRQRYSDEYETIRRAVEADLYPQVIEAWTEKKGVR